MISKNIILDELAISRAITRISHEILEKNKSAKELAVVGIKTRGVPIAKRISDKIFEIEGIVPDMGVIDITLYRDDISQIDEFPHIETTVLDFEVKDKIIILADDVIYTGRTVKAGMDVITDIGRPKAIQLAVLIDRGHRELPIKPDFVGKNVPTSRDEIIRVNLKEVDSNDFVLIEKKTS